MLHL
jgi:hypothetical protein